MMAELPTLVPKADCERGTYLSARRINPIGFVYTGEWKFSEPHGFGRLYVPDRSYYIGTFVAGSANGYGRNIYSNCAYYEGQVRNNKA